MKLPIMLALVLGACAPMPISYPAPSNVTALVTFASAEAIARRCFGTTACTQCAPAEIPCHVWLPDDGYSFQQLGCLYDHEFRYHVMAYMRGEAHWADHPTGESRFCYATQTEPSVGKDGVSKFELVK